MSIMDEFKRLARPYEDDDDEELDGYEEEELEDEAEPVQPTRSNSFGSKADTANNNQNGRDAKVVSFNANSAAQLQVVLVKPEQFDAAAEIADHLMDKKTVVLNLETTEKEIGRRLLDFLGGVAYANRGKIQKVAAATYIITPFNVEMVGDLIDELENNNVYF
jgi:cell division inhibitor SepF